jgi:tyrosinase
MSYLTRRSFIQGIAALPLAAWLSQGARASEPFVRYDLATPQGAAMLQVYAEAVLKMQALGAGDPLSWTWTWYTHFVDGLTTKDSEIARVFGSTATSSSSLAVEMWNTCQSHSGQNANNFLPWHRMYVFFMEQIIRSISGHPEFAMPYWNYTSEDPAQRGIVPAQFRLPTDPVYGCLYRQNRTKLANTGQPIQLNQLSDPFDISIAMAKSSYSTVGKVQGFCRAIDSGVHSRLHILVGTAKNMGAVPYAARDPLFLVHHANIDRLWASWNANGGVNPTTSTWSKKQFVFADAQGQRVSSRLRDYFNMAALGYAYDALVAPPVVAGTFAQAAAVSTTSSSTSNATPEQLAKATGGAELGARPVRVRLLPVPGTPRTRVLGLDPTQSGKRTYIVVRDLHAWKQPEVLYHLYLTPPGSTTRLGPDNYVGNINFFDAEFHDHGHGRMADVLAENFYSFDVTEILKQIARRGDPNARDALSLVFVPGGNPTPGANPLVATIELIRQ